MQVTLKAVVQNDGKYLLLRNDRGELELPGGWPEAGETTEAALEREIEEELNVGSSVGRYLGGEAFEVVPGKSVFVVAFYCRLEGFSISISNEHVDWGWYALDELHEYSVPDVYLKLLKIADVV